MTDEGALVPSITIRNLDDKVKTNLHVRVHW